MKVYDCDDENQFASLNEYLKDYEATPDTLEKVFALNRKYNTMAEEEEDDWPSYFTKQFKEALEEIREEGTRGTLKEISRTGRRSEA